VTLRVGSVAHDPEPGPGERADDPVTGIELVVPSPEEHELVVGHPLQQLYCISDLVGAAGAGLQLCGDLLGAHRHWMPVGHRLGDRGQCRLDGASKLLDGLGAGEAVHLEVDERLVEVVAGSVPSWADEQVSVAPHREHRMEESADLESGVLDRHQHRGDDERCVIGDEVDDGERRVPAVVLDGGGVDPDQGVAGLAVPGKLEMGDRCAVELGWRPSLEVAARNVVVVRANEGLGRAGVLWAEAFAHSG
jgi:hypothetical protein